MKIRFAPPDRSLGIARFLFGIALALIMPARAADIGKPGIVRVQFEDRIYDIPTNYGSIRSGGIDAPPQGNNVFMFTVQMPDLAPHTAKNDAQFRQTGWHDQIGGLFDYVPGRKVLVGKDMLAISLTDQLIDASKFHVTPNGFRVYTPSVRSDSDVRTKTLPTGDVFVMRCAQKGQKYLIYPSCRVIESWQGFTLTYSFGLKYADQADVIDRQVKAMMISFREK